MPHASVTSLTRALITAVLGLALLPASAAAQGGTGFPPAGGAEIEQIIGATAGAVVLTGILLYLGVGHRRGRNRVLARLAAAAERRTNHSFPGWAILPAGLITVSLIT